MEQTLIITFPDQGPPQRWQHSGREVVYSDQGRTSTLRATEECMLDRWLLIGAISRLEHAAGLRLREDYYDGQVPLYSQRNYLNPEFGSTGQWLAPAEKRKPLAEAAYRRWREAIQAVGTQCSAPLLTVCCEDGTLPLNKRHVLRCGLQLLVRHYRM